MSMDLIAGTVILTAVFLVVAGVVGFFLTRSADGRRGALEEAQRGKVVLAVLLLVYFLGITDVFIITQQYNLAFTNLMAGIVLAAIQYFTGSARQPASEAERATPPAETTDPPGPDQ